MAGSARRRPRPLSCSSCCLASLAEPLSPYLPPCSSHSAKASRRSGAFTPAHSWLSAQLTLPSQASRRSRILLCRDRHSRWITNSGRDPRRGWQLRRAVRFRGTVSLRRHRAVSTRAEDAGGTKGYSEGLAMETVQFIFQDHSAGNSTRCTSAGCTEQTTGRMLCTVYPLLSYFYHRPTISPARIG